MSKKCYKCQKLLKTLSNPTIELEDQEGEKTTINLCLKCFLKALSCAVREEKND